MRSAPEIHVSDVKGFKECRWRWEWQSPLHHNLEPDKPVVHFLLGRAVHYALEQYYEGNDALIAYEEYMEKDLDLITHLDTMPDEDKSKIITNVQLGRGMIAHYLTWAPARDSIWEVLSTEMTFDVPRTDRNLEYQLSGRFDGVWRKKSDGSLWIKEFKTSASHDYDWIYRDEQPMVYAYAAEHIFDQPIAGILYTFMFKKVPDFPRRLKNGDWSVAKNQNTTAAFFVEALRQDARSMAPNDPDKQNELVNTFTRQYHEYITYLQEEKGDYYFQRIEVKKTPQQLAFNMELIDMTANDMLDPAVSLYPAPNPIKCRICPFNDPCRVRMGGGDPSSYLTEDFRLRVPWENPNEKVNA
jgi:hypothetical protein